MKFFISRNTMEEGKTKERISAQEDLDVVCNKPYQVVGLDLALNVGKNDTYRDAFCSSFVP